MMSNAALRPLSLVNLTESATKPLVLGSPRKVGTFITSLSLALLINVPAHADIPVESRPLSTPEAPAVSTGEDQTSQVWLLNQKIQRLQEEVRILRGKVESHDNDIDQLQKDAQNHFTDFDQRLTQLQDDVKKLQAASAPAAPTDPNAPVGSNQTNNAVNTANTAPVNTANPDSPNAPDGNDADKTAYIAAYEAYKSGGAAQAIAPMKQFIHDYPQSAYVPNAYYWLGEFNLAITPPNFATASSNFKIVVNQYPKSAKAAAATYRLATLADVDQHQATAISLMQTLVKNYPGTQEAGFATDYLKSHTSPAEKKPEARKAEVKKTEIKKSEASKQDSKDITEHKKTKPVKKPKAQDDDSSDDTGNGA